MFEVTVRMLSKPQAEAWRCGLTDNSTSVNPRTMTAAWVIVDAAPSVVMPYTLPVDLVPSASTTLLLLILIAVVQVSRAYARRRLRTLPLRR
jgi:hypothetical protein